MRQFKMSTEEMVARTLAVTLLLGLCAAIAAGCGGRPLPHDCVPTNAGLAGCAPHTIGGAR